MNEIIVGVAGEAVKQLVIPFIQAGYTKFKSMLSSKEQARNFEENYSKYCEDIFYIRTLSSRQNLKFIDDFYVPLLLKGINTYSLEVGGNTQLNTENRGVLIKGFAGQGKSTILRKLVLNNIRNNKIPIFFELKNFNGKTLLDSISEDLNKVGIPISFESLKVILNKNDVVLYLDAFDEARPEYRRKLIDEVRDFINSYNANIVITSRPDDDLNSLPNLDEYHVAFLDEYKIKEIIKKEAQDAEKASDLIRNLDNRIFNIDDESVFKTPILVSLYTISYNLGEEVPENLSSFYDKIFDAVFYIHDNLKGVSGILGLNLELIDHNTYELSSELIELFLCSTYLRVGVSHSHGLKGRRVEEFYLDKPEFLYGISSDFQSFYNTLFEKAYQKLCLDRNESQFCRKLANIGIYEDCGKICRLSLRGSIVNLGLTISQIEDALRLAIVELYMHKYNKSLSKINHLNDFMASSNVFKF